MKKIFFFVIETKGQGKNQVSMVYVEGHLVESEGEYNKIYFTHFNSEGYFGFSSPNSLIH